MCLEHKFSKHWPKKVDKEQHKFKESWRNRSIKIKVENNNRGRKVDSINNTKSWLFEKSNKTDLFEKSNKADKPMRSLLKRKLREKQSERKKSS